MGKQLSYADHMRRAMREQNITLRDIQKATSYSYEHLRKIRTGRPLLSKEVSDAIADYLSLDKKFMWELASVEKMKHKFGQVPAELVPAPDDRLKQYWPSLTREEKAEIISIAEAYYKKHQILSPQGSNEDELVAIIANASEKLGQMKKRSNAERRRA